MESAAAADKPKPPVKKGICCVCKEPRAKRDECLLTKNEEECKDILEQYKVCLRNEGFEVA